MTATDTPRTDAKAVSHIGFWSCATVPADFARGLERELAEAKQWLNERYKALSEADERAEKAEAEVERLKKLCEMALESAEDAVEERDLKRRIADDICSLRKDLNK